MDMLLLLLVNFTSYPRRPYTNDPQFYLEEVPVSTAFPVSTKFLFSKRFSVSQYITVTDIRPLRLYMSLKFGIPGKKSLTSSARLRPFGHNYDHTIQMLDTVATRSATWPSSQSTSNCWRCPISRANNWRGSAPPWKLLISWLSYWLT